MKKILSSIILLSFIFSTLGFVKNNRLFFAIKNEKVIQTDNQNNYPAAQDLFGTWVINYIIGAEYGYGGSKAKTYYTFYENFQIRRIEDIGDISTHMSGTWKLEDNILFIYDLDGKTTMKLKTVSFNRQNWVHKKNGDNIAYIATKLSDTPKYLPKSHPGESGNNISFDVPNSNLFDISQMYGTWKSRNNNDGTEFYFILYPDQRFCQFGKDGEINGSWTILGNEFKSYIDFRETPSITKTSTFSKTSWNYQSLRGNYTSKKISDSPNIPTAITSKPKSNQNINTIERNSPSNGGACWACNGGCKINCETCQGQGGKYITVGNPSYYDSGCKCYLDKSYKVWSTCTADGCYNGKTKCKYCKCK